MKKGKILFISPDYFGFNEVVYEGLSKYSGFDTEMVITNSPYEYKNFIERIQNFFIKTFTKKNLKVENKNKNLLNKLQKIGAVDFTIVNRTDMLTKEQLDLCNKNSGKTIALFWDSFDKIKGQKETIPFFDYCFSFDENDCKENNLLKINNFHFIQNADIENTNYDAFFLGVYDNRFEDLVQILRYLKRIGKKVGARIYSYETKKIPEDLKSNILLTNEIIPFNKAFIYNIDTKIIIDLGHHNQSGLSFRPFEAMGLRKKLITTNKHVNNYDFYNDNNICIIDNCEEIEINNVFFETEFSLSSKVIEKYSLQSWVEYIIKHIDENI